MEQLYKDPHTLGRMREGPLGAYVDEFARQLSDEGYSRAACRYALQVVADLGCWLSQRGLIALQLTAEHLECYLGCQSGDRHRRSGDAAILRRLLAVLIEKGLVVPEPASEGTPVEQLAQEFRLYLERERGLAPPTPWRSPELTRLCSAELTHCLGFPRGIWRNGRGHAAGGSFWADEMARDVAPG